MPPGNDPPGQPPECADTTAGGSLETNGAVRRRAVDQRCEKCDRPGVRFYDRVWCCPECGQVIMDALTDEQARPAPKKKGKSK